MKEKIIVFGSFVVDLMARTPHLPVPGETVKGSMFKMGPGGKGFNQGVAAHKAGADVSMITKLGNDLFGNIAIEAMKELNMNADNVFISEDYETGTALILVDETNSQNEIVVTLGACNRITEEEVRSIESVIQEATYLLIQLETNISAVNSVINVAHKHGVKIILNTAPVQEIGFDVLEKVDIITPNEVEAEILTGIKVDGEVSAKEAADWFFRKGVKNVVITLGSRGVFIATAKEQRIIPAYNVNAVDTTGAGDAFNGGLVAALSEGKNLWEAAGFANALAALSVQKIGTTPSMPTRKEIDAFIKSHPLEDKEEIYA